MNIFLRRLCFILLIIYTKLIIAADLCGPVFTDALQINGGGDLNSEIVFNCDSYIINSPDSILDTYNVSNPGGLCANTCYTVDCQASNQTSVTLDSGNFQFNENGQDITIKNNQSEILGNTDVVDYGFINVKNRATVSFVSQGAKTTYRIRRIEMGKNSTLNLEPGDYWIEDFYISKDSTINITSTGFVRLVLLNTATIDRGSGINISSSEPNSAKQLLIYAYSDLIFDKGNILCNGFVYAKGDVTIYQDSHFTGAISAKNIELKKGVVITYDPIAAAELELNHACDFPPTLTHFKIQHDGYGSYCIPESITVTAYNGAAISTGFDGMILLNTGTGKGTWSLASGNGQLIDAVSDDGKAIYIFNSTDNGQATFDLLYTNGPATMDVGVRLLYNAYIHDDNTEGNLTFAPTGFLLTNAPIASPPPATIASYNDTQISAIADNIYITSFGLRDDMSCGKVDTYTGNKNIKFWQSYINPSSGTLVSAINGNNVGTNEATAVPINLAFVNGESSFSTVYTDVGMIKLHALDNNVPEPATGIRGSTDNFVVKPAKFVINVPNNPAATDSSGGVFAKAGDDFAVEVSAQNNDNNITPNYGNELVPEGIKLIASTLVAPIDGRNGSTGTGVIGNNTLFNKIAPGVFRGENFYFDEVGIIRLRAMVGDENYLGVGNIEGTESQNVGRFIPHHFAVEGNTPEFNAGCASGGFTYLNQKFQYKTKPLITATALNKFNVVTENYKDTFWKMGASNINVNYTYNSATTPMDSTNANVDISVAQTGNGVGEIQLGDGGGIAFNKVSGTHIAPFNAEISAAVNVQDEDGVAYASNPYVFGGTGIGEGITFYIGNAIYQGRVSLSNTFGSEMQPLVMPLRVEYFNGSDYVVNSLDNCTSITNPANIGLTTNPTGLSTTATFGSFANGLGQINLTEPNQTGEVDVTLDLSATGTNTPHLQHDWPQDGNDGVFDDNPIARGTFGIYKGSDKVIFIQEVTD